jgi:uncharacterized protein (TIGR04255 family)
MAKRKAAKRAPAKAKEKTGKEYKKNFLKQVIARIDFALPISELDSSVPKEIAKAIKKSFAIAEPKKQVLQQVLFSTSAGVHQSKSETHQWIYHSKDRSKLVNITGEFVYIEYRKYSSFATLLQDMKLLCNAIFDKFNTVQAKRLGLRYIDNIEFPKESKPTDWSKYLHSDLLSGFKLADDQATIARNFNVLEFNYGDMRMRFQYGMPNPDFPAAIKRKQFVLDYDAYCDQLLGKDDIAPQLTRFHDKIKASFEQVITDGLREVMRNG